MTDPIACDYCYLSERHYHTRNKDGTIGIVIITTKDTTP